jgi:CheY-like chemotaxis protein
VRALVVDDVQENRDILSAMLRQMGCRAEVATGGLEAIECAKRQVPDIVFLDLRMPGMDGMETLGRLKEVLEGKAGAREQGPPASASSDDGDGEGLASPISVRFVAVSASVLGHERDRCLTSGFDAFLGKPFLVSELVALLDRLLDVTWAATESAVAEPGALTVPPELLGRLKSCARGYRVTELKQGLTELEQLGPAGAALATRLRRLAQFSRMTEAIALIEEVRAQPNPGTAP